MRTLYRGSHAGVFTGANGYYAAPMAEDGVSHYQPHSGDGWTDAALRAATAEAKGIDAAHRESDEQSRVMDASDRAARWCPYCCLSAPCLCGFVR